MSRADPQQGMPPSAVMPGFPAVRARGGRVWRAHRSDRSPWWFANAGTGRFDLVAGRGTCYAADDPETAMRESLGPLASGGKTITRAAAERLAVSAIRLPSGAYAAVTGREAVRHGVLRELVTTTDSALTQAWAAVFDASGFRGVRYASRFTTAPGPNAWAVFGRAGAADRAVGRRIDGMAACAAAGIPVAPPPGPRSSFTVLDDV